MERYFSVVGIPFILLLQLGNLEDDDPASLVPQCQMLPLLIEFDNRDEVLLVHLLAALIPENLRALIIAAPASVAVLHPILFLLKKVYYSSK